MILRKKERTPKARSLHRLKILRGQLDGMIRMVESDTPCDQILPQIKAVKNAFASFAKESAKTFFLECREKKMSDREVECLFEAVAKF